MKPAAAAADKHVENRKAANINAELQVSGRLSF